MKEDIKKEKIHKDANVIVGSITSIKSINGGSKVDDFIEIKIVIGYYKNLKLRYPGVRLVGYDELFKFFSSKYNKDIRDIRNYISLGDYEIKKREEIKEEIKNE